MVLQFHEEGCPGGYLVGYLENVVLSLEGDGFYADLAALDELFDDGCVFEPSPLPGFRSGR